MYLIFILRLIQYCIIFIDDACKVDLLTVTNSKSSFRFGCMAWFLALLNASISSLYLAADGTLNLETIMYARSC